MASKEDLIREYRPLLMKANRQISIMKKHPEAEQTFAYKTVNSWLEKEGLEKFPSSKDLSYNQLQHYIALSEKYTNMKTFTFKGAKETAEKSFKSLFTNRDLDAPKMTKVNANKLVSLFQSKGWSEIKGTLASDQIVSLFLTQDKNSNVFVTKLDSLLENLTQEQINNQSIVERYFKHDEPLDIFKSDEWKNISDENVKNDIIMSLFKNSNNMSNAKQNISDLLKTGKTDKRTINRYMKRGAEPNA